MGLAAGVIAVYGVVVASPAIVIAGGVLGAISFFTTTSVGAATSIVLDAVPEAILDGKVEFEDAVPTLEFLRDQITEEITEEMIGTAVGSVYGELGEQLTIVAMNAIDTINNFVEEQVEPAFEDGTLPEEGVPESPFRLGVSATTSPYVITAQTSPPIDGETVRIQVSGTDGYRATFDRPLESGSATVSPLPGSSGVVDTINVFDVGGRATASTQVTF